MLRNLRNRENNNKYEVKIVSSYRANIQQRKAAEGKEYGKTFGKYIWEEKYYLDYTRYKKLLIKVKHFKIAINKNKCF